MAESLRASGGADSQPYLLGADVHLILVNPAGQVLFVRRDRRGYPGGAWDLPSGPLEADESMTAALARIAREAVGVIVDEEAATFAHVMHASSEGGRLVFFFVVDNWTGEPGNRQPDLCRELAWFSLSAFPYYLTACCRIALEWIVVSRWFSTFGW